jgi:hypothetical protein
VWSLGCEAPWELEWCCRHISCFQGPKTVHAVGLNKCRENEEERKKMWPHTQEGDWDEET